MVHIFPESRGCFGNLLAAEEKIVRKKGLSQGVCGTNPFHQRWFDKPNSKLWATLSQCASTAHLQATASFEVWNQHFDLFSSTPWWQGCDLNIFPHKSIQTNKYVNICEAHSLTEVVLTSAAQFSSLGNRGT